MDLFLSLLLPTLLAFLRVANLFLPSLFPALLAFLVRLLLLLLSFLTGLLAFLLSLLLALFVNVAFVLLVFGRRIGEWIADMAGLGTAFDVTWNMLRWPISIAAIAVILAVLYYAGPDVEQSFRWISPGSIFATVLWLIATALVGIYLTFSNPGSAYGVVGSVLVLLFFLYVTGLVFLLGAELNALLGKRYDPETVRDLATKPEAKPETRAQAQRRVRHVT